MKANLPMCPHPVTPSCIGLSQAGPPSTCANQLGANPNNERPPLCPRLTCQSGVCGHTRLFLQKPREML